MSSRNEVKSLIDQLPDASLEVVESTIRHLLTKHEAEHRFQITGEEAQGYSGWEHVHNGFRVGSQMFHRVEGNELIVQTLYTFLGSNVEMAERLSLTSDKAKLQCRLMLKSGDVTLRHVDEFPVRRESSER